MKCLDEPKDRYSLRNETIKDATNGNHFATYTSGQHRQSERG